MTDLSVFPGGELMCVHLECDRGIRVTNPVSQHRPRHASAYSTLLSDAQPGLLNAARVRAAYHAIIAMKRRVS